MANAKRPEMLSEEVFRESLRQQGCHPKYIDAYVGDCKLLVPLLIREVDEDKFLDLANRCRAELGLKPIDTYWPQSVRYIVSWATEAIEKYKASKVNRV
ncbi:MAG: hypothetical protein NVS3B14_06650 [Ktedonobacteraceae bacterium]